MPSIAHEVPLILLRERPDWLRSLLSTLGHSAPAGPLVIDDSTLRGPDAAEVRPDLCLTSASGPLTLFEVQLAIEANKGRRWALACAIAYDRRRLPPNLVVLVDSRAVAAWALRTGRVRSESGTRLTVRPVVVRLDENRARRLLRADRPELCFFAAWAVRDQVGPAAQSVVRRALAIAAAQEGDLRATLTRAILTVLDDRLAELLNLKEVPMVEIPASPTLLEIEAKLEARIEARITRRVTEEVTATFTEQVAAAAAEQITAAKRGALLAVFEARGVALDDASQARVAAQTDGATLDRWIRRAATVPSAADALD